jgi:hypothetical protein
VLHVSERRGAASSRLSAATREGDASRRRAASEPEIGPIAAYLAAVDRGVPAGRRARRAIVTELADGLACSVQAHVDAGLPADEAAVAAVAEFGDPRELAANFAHQLAGSTAHRTGLALVVTGPMVGLTWVAAYAAHSGAGWREQIAAVLTAVPSLAVILVVVVPAAIVAAAGAGRLARRVPVAARAAATAAVLAAFGCVAGDAMLLSTAVVTALHRPSWTVLVGVAVGVSTVRLAAAATAGRRCALLRAAAR